jgi:hypothetical protein
VESNGPAVLSSEDVLFASREVRAKFGGPCAKFEFYKYRELFPFSSQFLRFSLLAFIMSSTRESTMSEEMRDAFEKVATRAKFLKAGTEDKWWVGAQGPMVSLVTSSF